MRIQHNIMAMNAYRNYTNNVSAMKSNLEKLSSGYKINRAGDDAAGLAISEKMRAQISGLQTAQKNAKDGISLIQTAEGALTEVHDMLGRMVELASQSANGTYDNDVDRAQMQKEIDQLRSEINRIADSSNFNGIKLLDGSMGSGRTTASVQTNIPILQKVATDPTLEVGTKTVLHEDGPDVGKTEIKVELHNTSFKGQEGDILKVTVGDAEIELKVTATGSGTGELKTDQAYKADELAQKIVAAFNGSTKVIKGQAFSAELSGDKAVVFKQTNNPTDASEVVGANVPVKIEHVVDPLGNPVEYTMKIKDDVLGDGSKITLGGEEITLDNTLSGKFGTTEAAIGTKGYMAKYANGTLTIKDPDGSLGAPTMKYNDYEKPVKITADESAKAASPAEDATKSKWVAASAPGAVALSKAADDNKYKVTIGGLTYSVKGKTAASQQTNWLAAFATANSGFTATISGGGSLVIHKTANDATSEGSFTGSISGLVTGGTVSTGADTYTIGNAKLTTPSTIDQTAAQNKYKVSIGGIEKEVGVNYGSTGKQIADAWKTAYDADGTPKFDVEVDANGIVTMEAKTEGTDATAGISDGNRPTGGTYTEGKAAVASAAGYVKYDLSGLKDGDKIKIGTKEYIYDTNLSTTLDAEALTAIGSEVTGIATLEDNKLVLTGKTATADGPTATVSVAKAKEAELKGEAKDSGVGVSGTWNVQSTVNKEGGYDGADQLASTAFTLTKDIVADGNTLTIGEGKYTFKVGKDSKTEAAEGATLIDLSKVSDDKLIAEAAMALANESDNNSAFTIGYATDNSGKITIHEKEGQKVYTDELKSLAEFDKLVYVNSAETDIEGGSLTLQIGDTAESFNQLKVSINDCHTDALGIADISIADQASAAVAVDKIKQAINQVSDVRGTLGATQNRLDHTINNLSVMTENIQDAESTIRDVDVAEEMMAYTKNNILIQSAQAMLAQANQVPQGVLQLLG